MPETYRIANDNSNYTPLLEDVLEDVIVVDKKTCQEVTTDYKIGNTSKHGFWTVLTAPFRWYKQRKIQKILNKELLAPRVNALIQKANRVLSTKHEIDALKFEVNSLLYRPIVLRLQYDHPVTKKLTSKQRTELQKVIKTLNKCLESLQKKTDGFFDRNVTKDSFSSVKNFVIGLFKYVIFGVFYWPYYMCHNWYGKRKFVKIWFKEIDEAIQKIKNPLELSKLTAEQRRDALLYAKQVLFKIRTMQNRDDKYSLTQSQKEQIANKFAAVQKKIESMKPFLEMDKMTEEDHRILEEQVKYDDFLVFEEKFSKHESFDSFDDLMSLLTPSTTNLDGFFPPVDSCKLENLVNSNSESELQGLFPSVEERWR